MKYIVTINQAAAVKVAPELDFNDLAILDFIRGFATSGKCESITEGKKAFFWISHTLIMSELPLLHISTKMGMMKRINKLIKANLLIKHPNCDALGKTLYAFGDAVSLLETSTKDPQTKVDTPETKIYTPKTEVYGGYKQTFTGGINKSLGNNINNTINKINDNDSGEIEISHTTPTLNPIIKEKVFECMDKNPPTCAPDIISVDVEEITGDTITVNTETITPPSSAAPPLNDEARANKKTLFRNSTAADRETFFKTFGSEEYATLDMEHYYNAVADWSDSSNTMRTARGWFATVRTFIRGDKEKNKLHKKQTNSGFDWDAANAYLRM